MRSRFRIGLALVAAGLGLAAGGGEHLQRAVRAGLRAWEAGDVVAADAAFAEAEALAGPEPVAELAFDRALAALTLGDLPAAEAALARWGEVPGEPLAARRAFVAGCLTLARARDEGERARVALGLAPGETLDEAARAALPGEVQAVVQRALLLTEAALGQWREAELQHGDWPAARRNAERALLDARALRALLPPPPPIEENPERRTDTAPEQPPPPTDPDQQLTPEQLDQLLEMLAERERQREERRRERRGTARGGVERDW